MRFRRRIRIAPGLGLNLSGSGVGLSAGIPGLSASIGKRGVWGYTSIPGTGLYRRNKLFGGKSMTPTSSRPTRHDRGAELLDYFSSSGLRLTAPLDGGPVALVDANGRPFTPDLEDAAWRHLRSQIIGQLTAGCDEACANIYSLATIHHTTPAPSPTSKYTKRPFNLRPPTQPMTANYHWLWRILPWHRRKIDSKNKNSNTAFQSEYKKWLEARSSHDITEIDRQNRFRLRDGLRKEDVEGFIEWHLAGLDWPHETLVDLKLSDDTSRLCLDVDLPEIEFLPPGTPEVAIKSRSLRIKPFSPSARRRLYAAHVHAVLFRLAGEVFHAAPTVQEISVSGYTQRPDKATAAIKDDYLISVIIKRSSWLEIDFSSIEHVEAAEALSRFPIRRNMTSTGLFRPIEPFT